MPCSRVSQQNRNPFVTFSPWRPMGQLCPCETVGMAVMSYPHGIHTPFAQYMGRDSVAYRIRELVGPIYAFCFRIAEASLCHCCSATSRDTISSFSSHRNIYSSWHLRFRDAILKRRARPESGSDSTSLPLTSPCRPPFQLSPPIRDYISHTTCRSSDHRRLKEACSTNVRESQGNDFTLLHSSPALRHVPQLTQHHPHPAGYHPKSRA